MLSEPESIRRQQARIVVVARKMLNLEMSIIEGSRELVRLRHDLAIDSLDPDFLPFVAIDSETDDLPVGAERQDWAENALAEKDQLIAQAEKAYRQAGFAACRVILQRFQPESD
jgi:hypothetical protein